MPKIKLTKSELKAQRDALKQFARFLPTLQLKKQQLQLEAMKTQERVAKTREREQTLQFAIGPWVELFGDRGPVDKLASVVKVDSLEVETHNIAGVKVPVFKAVKFSVAPYDLFLEDPWLDDAIRALQEIVSVRAERDVIEEQARRLNQELRVTTQRVNLFEKVKIPECKENIRTIQIYLGDQQTAAVGRSKIAKRKSQEVSL